MDLQSAAAAVLGYRQAPVKGKAIEVAPVHEVATEHLRALLRSALPPQARPVLHAVTHTRRMPFLTCVQRRHRRAAASMTHSRLIEGRTPIQAWPARMMTG